MTRFDLATNTQYKFWYTIKVYSAADVDSVMKATEGIEHAMLDDAKIGFFLTLKPGVLVAGLLYNGGRPPSNVFSQFDAINSIAVPVPETISTQLSFARAASMADGGR